MKLQKQLKNKYGKLQKISQNFAGLTAKPEECSICGEKTLHYAMDNEKKEFVFLCPDCYEAFEGVTIVIRKWVE